MPAATAAKSALPALSALPNSFFLSGGLGTELRACWVPIETLGFIGVSALALFRNTSDDLVLKELRYYVGIRFLSRRCSIRT